MRLTQLLPVSRVVAVRSSSTPCRFRAAVGSFNAVIRRGRCSRWSHASDDPMQLPKVKPARQQGNGGSTAERSNIMDNYVDVFVVPVPKKNMEAYREQAELFVKVWREHGAVSCIEIEADDAPRGKVTSFPQSVDLQPDETVFVGIVTYRSRAHRDEVSANAMKDPRMAGMGPQS